LNRAAEWAGFTVALLVVVVLVVAVWVAVLVAVVWSSLEQIGAPV
jgi:hypothetical protein